MDIRITPRRLSGEIVPPVSKSELHRLLIAAALADGSTTIALPARATGNTGCVGAACTADDVGGDCEQTAASHFYTLLSDDILATIDCLRELGATIEVDDAHISVEPIADTPRFVTLNARDSASTLRFLMPVASVLCEHVAWVGSDQLATRPLDTALAVLREHGVAITETNPSAALPLITDGFFACDEVTVLGDISSQYVSGMLFAAAALAKLGNTTEKTVRVQGELSSASYAALTVDVLRRFGLDISLIDKTAVDAESQTSSHGYRALPQNMKQTDGQTSRQTEEQGTHNPLVASGEDANEADNAVIGLSMYNAAWLIQAGSWLVSPGDVNVSCDWSNAAPWLALATCYSELSVSGLDAASIQGDKACAEWIQAIDTGSLVGNSSADSLADNSAESSLLEDSLLIDMQNTPDLFPVLACLAAARMNRMGGAHGSLEVGSDCEVDLVPGASREVRFVNIARLRHKESDRIASTAALIEAFGGNIDVAENEFVVRSSSCSAGEMEHDPVICPSAHDHRIVMAATLCAHLFNREVIIQDAECVAKSYPTFFDDYRSLGGVAQ